MKEIKGSDEAKKLQDTIPDTIKEMDVWIKEQKNAIEQEKKRKEEERKREAEAEEARLKIEQEEERQRLEQEKKRKGKKKKERITQIMNSLAIRI